MRALRFFFIRVLTVITVCSSSFVGAALVLEADELQESDYANFTSDDTFSDFFRVVAIEDAKLKEEEGKINELIKGRRYDEASYRLSDLQRKHPQIKEYVPLRAWLIIQLGGPEGAEAYLERKLETSHYPIESELLYAMLGYAELQQEKFDEAYESYRRTLQFNRSKQNLMRLATLAAKLEKRNEAADFLREILDEDAFHGPALGLRGKLAYDLEDYSTAIFCGRKRTELEPESAVAYEELGKALLKMGNHPIAVDCLEKAVELDPFRATAHAHLSIAMLKQGETMEKVMGGLATALDINIKLAFAWDELLRLVETSYASELKVTEAIKRLREDPRHHPSYRTLAEMTFSTRSPAPAFIFCRMAHILDPHNDEHLRALLHVLKENRKNPMTIGIQQLWISRATQVNPVAVDLAETGVLFFALGKHEDALMLLEGASREAKTNPGYHFITAFLCVRTGNTEKALRHLSDVMRLSPGDAEAYHLFAKLNLEHADEYGKSLEASIRSNELTRFQNPTYIALLTDIYKKLEIEDPAAEVHRVRSLFFQRKPEESKRAP